MPVEPGTIMQKVIPPNLVEPYLTGQRSVIAGFAHQAEDASLLNLTASWSGSPGRAVPGDQEEGGGRRAEDGVWVLRWRALGAQAFRIPPAALLAYGASQRAAPAGASLPESGRAIFEVFLGATPIPVDTEMFQLTPDGERFIARFDGQAWLRPAPGA